MWDLTTALDQYCATRGGGSTATTSLSAAPVAADRGGQTSTVMGLKVRYRGAVRVIDGGIFR